MNKAELIEATARKADITKQDSEIIVNAVFDEITKTLEKSEPVQITGFGTFKTRKHSARVGKNPRTGAMIQIAESTVPAFRPGKILKDSINR